MHSRKIRHTHLEDRRATTSLLVLYPFTCISTPTRDPYTLPHAHQLLAQLLHAELALLCMLQDPPALHVLLASHAVHDVVRVVIKVTTALREHLVHVLCLTKHTKELVVLGEVLIRHRDADLVHDRGDELIPLDDRVDAGRHVLAEEFIEDGAVGFLKGGGGVLDELERAEEDMTLFGLDDVLVDELLNESKERGWTYIRPRRDGAVDLRVALQLSHDLLLDRPTGFDGRHLLKSPGNSHSSREGPSGGSDLASDGDAVLERVAVASLLPPILRGARRNHRRRANRGCDLARNGAHGSAALRARGSRRDFGVR
jgi:hypothetical protein